MTQTTHQTTPTTQDTITADQYTRKECERLHHTPGTTPVNAFYNTQRR